VELSWRQRFIRGGAFDRRLLRESLWIVLGQVCAALGLLAGMRLLTEFLNPEQYALLSLYIAGIALAIGVAVYPFIDAANKLFPEAQRQGSLRALRSARQHFLLVTALPAGSLVTCLVTLPWGLVTSANQMLVAIILYWLTAIRELQLHWLFAAREHKRAAIWQMGESLLRPTLAFTMLLLLGASVSHALAGYVAALMLLSGLAWKVSEPAGYWAHSTQQGELCAAELRPALWHLALPLIPARLLQWAYFGGTRLLLLAIVGAGQFGLYAAVAVLMHEGYNRIAAIFERALRPIYFEAYSQADFVRANRVLGLWLGLLAATGILGTLLLAVGGPWVAAILLAAPYRGAAALMPWLGAASAIFALSAALRLRLLAIGASVKIMKARIIGVVVALVLMPWMASRYGIHGAAMVAPVYIGAELLAMVMYSRRPAAKPMLASVCPRQSRGEML
jgi:O-antigen/teichoic acid export membrane protein